MRSLIWPLLSISSLLCVSGNPITEEKNFIPIINTFNPDYGVYLGELNDLADGDVSGKVYLINETALQVFNFSYNGKDPDVYFWLDRETEPTPQGVKIHTFEFGITPLGAYKNAERVVLLLPPEYKIGEFKSFNLYSFKYNAKFSNLIIPDNVIIPKAQFIANDLKGNRYSVGAGPILAVDRRTIKVFGFTFDGDKAPDAYFFVGRGPSVSHEAGVKVPIRGRDSAELVTAMQERYRGGRDIMLTLPEEYDMEHIDWLSIYCYKFRVDFGHITVSNVSQTIPPYVPLQKRFDEMEMENEEKWNTTVLLGNDERRNFTMQIGLPGGKKGYQAMARNRPAKYVWYVNGYLAEIYLRRGVTYSFIVEGGDDKNTEDFYNPFYISNDSYGGYNKLSTQEKSQIKIFAGSEPNETAGRLCVWSADDGEENSQQFQSFIAFRNSLQLMCEEQTKPQAIVDFTPDDSTPDTLYFNSYEHYYMGYKIHIVKDLPDIPDIKEEPFDYEHWSAHRQSQSTSHFSLLAAFLLLLVSIFL